MGWRPDFSPPLQTQAYWAYLPGVTTDAETMIVPNDFPELLPSPLQEV